MKRTFFILLCAAWIAVLPLGAAERFAVGAYNVQNYLLQASDGRPAKSQASRARVREMIHALDVDVLALVEMGNTNALLELRDALAKEGRSYPHWEHVTGYDTNIHLALLSRFPIVARRPHERDSFLLGGRRLRVSRGFLEVDVQVNASYQFTLLAAHLKSKRPVPFADEAEMRLEEAALLRQKADAAFARNPDVNLVVLGDLNDFKDSRPVRAIIGRPSNRHLVDTRPAENNGDTRIPEKPGYSPMNIAWTHFYGKEDTYSRLDYLLLSKGMAAEWVEKGTWVLARPHWGEASDHRPVRAEFVAGEK